MLRRTLAIGKNCLTSILEQYLSSTWNQKAEGKFHSQMWHSGFIPLVHSSVSAQLALSARLQVQYSKLPHQYSCHQWRKNYKHHFTLFYMLKSFSCFDLFKLPVEHIWNWNWTSVLCAAFSANKRTHTQTRTGQVVWQPISAELNHQYQKSRRKPHILSAVSHWLLRGELVPGRSCLTLSSMELLLSAGYITAYITALTHYALWTTTADEKWQSVETNNS